MATGSLQSNISLGGVDGILYFIPAGTALLGESQSLAVPNLYQMSMSANTNKLHTPSNATASYFTVSSSNLATDQSYTFYYYNTGSHFKNRLLLAPNSSSVNGGYGSQWRACIKITSSITPYTRVDHYYLTQSGAPLSNYFGSATQSNVSHNVIIDASASKFEVH